MSQRLVLRILCDDSGNIAFLFGAWGAVDCSTASEQVRAGCYVYRVRRRDGSVATLSLTERHGVDGLLPFLGSGR